MTPQARIRRIGWFALLTVCTVLYGVLHFQVWSVSSEVKKAERVIVALEEQNLLLETEFLTRSSQLQLAAWNRVDFGYSAPAAEQFIENERQLARFSSPRAENAPEPIRLASFSADAEAPPFPQLVSPLGRNVDVALIEPSRPDDGGGRVELVAALAERSVRIPLSASSIAGTPATVRVSLGGAGQ